MTWVVSPPHWYFSQRKCADSTTALHSARNSGRWRNSGVLIDHAVKRVRNREQSVTWVIQAALCSHSRWKNDRVNKLPLSTAEDKKSAFAEDVRKRSGRVCTMANHSSQESRKAVGQNRHGAARSCFCQLRRTDTPCPCFRHQGTTCTSRFSQSKSAVVGMSDRD